MKLTDSPVVELPVRESLLSIQQDNGSMNVGTPVSPCSLVLVKFAEQWTPNSANTNPYSQLLDFHSTRHRAIEFGTGCGAALMAFYLLGLTDIVVSDISRRMPALKRSKLVLNKKLKASVLCGKNQEQIKALNPPFDEVIVADVVYIEESACQLVEAMEALAADDGDVLLGYQSRSVEAHELFWQMCEKVFVIEKVPHEDLHPEYRYKETDVYIFKKKKIIE